MGTKIDSCTLSLTGSSAIPFPVSNRAASISVSSFLSISVCESESNLADLKLVGSLTCKTLTGSSGGRNACGRERQAGQADDHARRNKGSGRWHQRAHAHLPEGELQQVLTRTRRGRDGERPAGAGPDSIQGEYRLTKEGTRRLAIQVQVPSTSSNTLLAMRSSTRTPIRIASSWRAPRCATTLNLNIPFKPRL